MKDEIISRKLDLTLRAISVIPVFIAATHDKRSTKMWTDALKQWQEIYKEYKNIFDYEHNNDTTSVKDKIS